MYATLPKPYFFPVFVCKQPKSVPLKPDKLSYRMRFFYSTLLFLTTVAGARAQAVTTQPAFPTADQPVTITVDLTQVKDSRAKGLLGKTSDVYLWSGAGSTETGEAFQFTPAGQTDFSKPFTPGTMTPLGNDKWQIKLTPRAYYGVPANMPIRRLGLVIKNGSGTAQTEDLFTRIYDNKLSITRLAPAQKDFYVEANAPIPVRAAVSAKATLTLTQDAQVLTTVTGGDSLSYVLRADAQTGVKRRVILQAQTATETAADTFYYTVNPQPKIAELPAGLNDGINYLSGSRVVLSLYAPLKKFVYVIGEFNNWQPVSSYLMNRTADGNRYWLELPAVTAGQEVAFQYLVDGTIAVADPYADKILDRNNDLYIPTPTYPGLKPFPVQAPGNIVSVLQTDQTSYPWKTAGFVRPDAKNMVVYELLVRDFTANRNYKTLTDTLTYLKRLGINTIELMPVMEFSGNDSWGYNPIFYFAPDKAYGTKNDLKTFIDKAHEMGMAVVLDMVLNQADYEFPYVRLYYDGDRPAANSPFFNPQATHPYSVFFDFNHESADTKNLVDRITRYWLQEYKMDGYRFDLSKGFTQKNSGSDVAAWGNYDASRVAIWKRIYDKIRTYDPTAYVILEHFADNSEETELANYGMLFWGNSNYDYRQAAKGNVSDPSYISYKQRGWKNPNVVGYLESHDEERLVYDVVTNGNGNSNGAYTTRNLATALERAKLAAAFFLPIPGPKLIWQFGEVGYDINIDQNGRTGAKPVKWDYAQDPARLRLFKVYQELIKLKKTQPVFQTTDFSLDFGGLLKRMTLNSPAMTLYGVGNFDTKASTQPANFPLGGTWYDYFTGQSISVADPYAPATLLPGEFHLYTTTKLPTPEAGLVPWTATAIVTGVEEPGTDGLVVSPNPTADMVVVSLDNVYRGIVSLTLTTGAGQSVRTHSSAKTGTFWRQTLSLRDLPTGVYYLTVQQGDERAVRKVLKF